MRDEFFLKTLVNPDAIKGLDSLLKEAVNLKFITAPLTQQQLADRSRSRRGRRSRTTAECSLASAKASGIRMLLVPLSWYGRAN